MRTSGPCRPSGRRPASTCRAGSGPGRASRARSRSATACAAREAASSGAPGSGSCTNMHVGVAGEAHLPAAEPAHGDHRHPGRQRPAGLLRLGDGRLQRGGHGDRGHRGQRLAPVCDVGQVRGRQAMAVRSSSRRRMASTARDRVVGARRAGRPRPGPRPAARRPGAAPARRSSASIATASGARSSRPVGVPAGGQQPGHPLRHQRVVPQQPQVPGRVAERLADLAEGEQARRRAAARRRTSRAARAAASAGWPPSGPRPS